MPKERKQTLRELADLHKIDHSLLGRWQREGLDIWDSREVAIKALKSRTPVKSWIETKSSLFSDSDEDSHEYWKREKTKEEVEGLRLKNAKAAGEMFDRADGEKVKEQVAAAFKIGLAERRGTAPQILAGKEEAWISKWMDDADHELLTNLSDLESALWKEVFDQYASSDVTKGSASPKPTAKGDSK